MHIVLILFLLCIYQLDALHLTWQNDPTTTMTVQWITEPSKTSNTLEVKKQTEESYKKIEGSHKSLPNDTPYIIHTVECQNLEPDTIYSFRLPQDEAVHLFRTMPRDLTNPIRFAVGGDAYHDDVAAFDEMATLVASKNPRFVLLGGDIAYSVKDKKHRKDEWSRWSSFLEHWSKHMKGPDGCIIPLIPVIGNHEVVGYYNQTPQEAKFFYALFACPGDQGYKVLHFNKYMSICLLDSNHTHPIAGAQTAWLQEALRQSYSRTHRFAIYHVPAYPSVRYFGMKESASIRRNWVPLFERYSLHAAFENHEHAYKRTHPLIDALEHPDGVVYFGDGSWGIKPRIPKRAFRTTYLAKTASCRQFLLVELSNETRNYQAIAINGEVIDSFSQKVAPPDKF